MSSPNKTSEKYTATSAKSGLSSHPLWLKMGSDISMEAYTGKTYVDMTGEEKKERTSLDGLSSFLRLSKEQRDKHVNQMNGDKRTCYGLSGEYQDLVDLWGFQAAAGKAYSKYWFQWSDFIEPDADKKLKLRCLRALKQLRNASNYYQLWSAINRVEAVLWNEDHKGMMLKLPSKHPSENQMIKFLH